MQNVALMSHNGLHRQAPVRRPATPSMHLSSSNWDKVTFAGDPEKTPEVTDTQRRQQVVEKAKALFEGKATLKGLVEAFQMAYPDVAIYNGSDERHQWVNDVCQSYGNVAFMHIPDSLRYGMDPTKVPNFKEDDPEEAAEAVKVPSPFPIWMRALRGVLTLPLKQGQAEPGFHDTYTEEILPDLYRDKKLALFVSKDATRGTLMHEMFHIIQYKEGLPFGTRTPDLKADGPAKDFNYEYNRPQFGNVMLDTAWQALSRGWSWLVQVPMVQAQRLLGMIKPDQNSPGQALREEMRREQEVDKFILFQGGKYGASIMDRVEAAVHYVMESKLKELLSYRLG